MAGLQTWQLRGYDKNHILSYALMTMEDTGLSRTRRQREAAYAQLVEQAQACRACPRMEGRTRVLGPGNGTVEAEVMFVAEAPGRLGGDRYNIPLYGDRTGHNFAALLEAAGIEPSAIFVTNAVLCNPRKEDGTNDTPRTTEIARCSMYLRATIELVQPRFIITLGTVALSALNRIEPHSAELSTGVGLPIPWYGRILVPLYHPGPRALIRRPFAAQMEDYRQLGCIVRE